MRTTIHMADLLPNISVNLLVLELKFGKIINMMLACSFAESEYNRGDTFLNPHITNIHIFELPVVFIPHLSVNLRKIL